MKDSFDQLVCQADGGDGDACYLVGRAYRNGCRYGFGKKYLRMAIANGNETARSFCIENGIPF